MSEEPGIISEKGVVGPQSKSLVEQIAELKEQVNADRGVKADKFRKKSFRFPFKVKRHTRNLKKMMHKNKVQVILLKSTGAIEPTVGEINTGRLIIGNNYWNAADSIIWHWMNKVPTAVVCDWDMQPVTKNRLMQDTDELKTWLHPQTIIIRAIEAKEALEAKGKVKFNPVMLLVIGGALLAMWYLFF